MTASPLAPPGANALTFHYEFEHENDCVYFACIQPYTYTVSARVHPGEPNSSWMMQGMLDYLTGPSSGATVLRRNFVFKVVPMLNPDGVINGNTRVNLAGWDLNRKWNSPIEQLFPTIYHLKQQLAHFQSRGRVAIYCDLHGHSINRNIFTYGCYSAKKKSSTDGSKAPPDTVGLSLLLYYGLTSQVKALDTERKKQVTQPGIIIEAPSPSRPSAQAQVDEVLQVDIEDEESRLARDLLLDCEAAISALFASSGVDVNGEVDEMDSDLSGAEEEPIPPSPEGDTQQVTSCSESLDEVDAVKAKESPSTVLEELSTTVNPSEDSDKKPDTKKQRGSKFKAVVSQTIKKAEKPKKKKKRKGKPELRRTTCDKENLERCKE
ncbi:hypothetical protein PInf_010231 [Phytophthora infestans]|nr:hypothetical protein PInf_010231 [Phytophthora infestans]